jgi:histone acetyltransferase (RNA polymerase elongator complex component)
MIIPIFIKNRGCPHRCIFCNEKMIAGDRPEEITASYISEKVNLFLQKAGDRGNTQIAFYGGNFTGMDKTTQERFLSYATPFIENGHVDFLRVSTRPDAIDEASLDLLKAYDVRVVEIGVQSMNDEVLASAQRGHTSADVIRAVVMLKERQFEVGVHLMAGLPGDSKEQFILSVEKVIALAPASVRIHPVIVFRNTELAKMLEAGKYRPLSIDEAVSLCKEAVRKFQAAGIPVIRLGLQATRDMEEPGSILAGPYHPAFGALVHESIFADMAVSLLSERMTNGKKIGFRVSPQDISHLRGHGNRNLKAIMERFGLDGINVISDPQQTRGEISLLENDGSISQGRGRKKR